MTEFALEMLLFLIESCQYRLEMYKFLHKARDDNNVNYAWYRSFKITKFHVNHENNNEIEGKDLAMLIDQLMYIFYKYEKIIPETSSINMNFDIEMNSQCGVFTWSIERLIWIAFYKQDNKKKNSLFSTLPKDLIKHIITFLNNKNEIEPIIFKKIEKLMGYIMAKYINIGSDLEINISHETRKKMLQTHQTLKQLASNNESKDNNNDNDQVDVDFITCFDQAMQEMIALTRSSLVRFARNSSENYQRLVKYLKKRKQHPKEKIASMTNNSTQLTIEMQNYGRSDLIDDQLNELNGNDKDNDNNEQKTFYFKFIKPTRQIIENQAIENE